MLHLRRSIRAACGEALGAAAVSELIEIGEHLEPADLDSRWTDYARDYVDEAIEAMRHWRESRERDAANVSVASYDDWLRFTGRYERSI